MLCSPATLLKMSVRAVNCSSERSACAVQQSGLYVQFSNTSIREYIQSHILTPANLTGTFYWNGAPGAQPGGLRMRTLPMPAYTADFTGESAALTPILAALCVWHGVACHAPIGPCDTCDGAMRSLLAQPPPNGYKHCMIVLPSREVQMELVMLKMSVVGPPHVCMTA